MASSTLEYINALHREVNARRNISVYLDAASEVPYTARRYAQGCAETTNQAYVKWMQDRQLLQLFGKDIE